MAVFLAGSLPAAIAAPQAADAAQGAVLPPEALQRREIPGGSMTFSGETEISLLEEDVSGNLAVQAEAGGQEARSSFSQEYYGDQLSEPCRIIYNAVTGSALMDGPAVISLELASSLPAEALTAERTLLAVKGADGTVSVQDSKIDSAPFQRMMAAASAALTNDYPGLSWLINTGIRMGYGWSDTFSADDWQALEALQPGESCELTGPVRLSSLTWNMPEESFRRATTAPEDAAAENPWNYADTGSSEDMDAAVREACREIGTLQGMTDAAKVKAVHDWLCHHTDYADKSDPRFQNSWRSYQTAYSALIERKSVCAGYARAMKLLLDAYGVPCVIANGQSHGEAHAWNYVRLGGRWYGLDATWADQNWGIDDSDFLKGSKVFFRDHTEGGLSGSADFAYPALAADDYVAGAAPAALPGDVNLDSTVNLADLARFAQLLWNEEDGPDAAELTAGDLNSNGSLDIEDLVSLTGLLRKNGYDQGAAAGSSQAVEISGPASVAPGQEVQITISGTGEVLSGQLAATGLEFVSVSSSLSDAGTFVLMPDYGIPSAEYTFRVTAANGDVSIRAENCCTADTNSVARTVDASWRAPVTNEKAALQEAIEALRIILNDRIGKTVWESADGKDVVQEAQWVPLGMRDRLMNEVLKPALRIAENENATEAEIAGAVQSVTAALAEVEAAIQQGTAQNDVVLTASGPLTAGSTVEITITLAKGSEYAGFSARVNTSGLTYQSNTGSPLSTEHAALLISMVTPSVTYKYLIAASAGAPVQFGLTDVELQTFAGDNVFGEPFGWRATVSTGGSSGITVPSVPQPLPAPEIPAVTGYAGGILNGRTYYTKTSGASMLFYQQRSSGSMGRVSVPYVTDADGTRYYSVNCGGTVLFPRLRNGSLEAYCRYEDGREIPVLAVQTIPGAAEDLQPFSLNGRQYYVRTSGASMLFYQKRSNGSMGRVSAPYVTDKNGTRFYPVNCGGTVLIPQLRNGTLDSYTAGMAAVLTPAA